MKGNYIGNLTSWTLLIINGVAFTTMMTIFNSQLTHPYYRVAIICFFGGVFFSFLSLVFHKLGRFFMILAICLPLVGAGAWFHDFLIQAKFMDGVPVSATDVTLVPTDKQLSDR